MPRNTPPPPEPFRPDDERNLVRRLAEQVASPAGPALRAARNNDDNLGILTALGAAVPAGAYAVSRMRPGLPAGPTPTAAAGVPGIGAGGPIPATSAVKSAGQLGAGVGPKAIGAGNPLASLGAGTPMRALGPGNPLASLADDVIATASRAPWSIPAGPTSAFPRAPIGTAARTATGFADDLGMAGFKSSIPAGPTSAFPRAAATLGDDLAAAAGGTAGGARGLLSRVTSGMSAPTSLRSGLGRGAVGLGISMAGNYLGEAAGGNESIMGRLLSGAGAGGGIGAFAGPKGALIGAVLGGLGNALLGAGDDGPAPDDVLTNALQYSGLTPESQNRITAVYKVMSELGDETEALNLAGQLIMDEMTAAQQHEQDLQTMLATQALTAEFFQPFTQQLLDAANLRAGITEQMAASLPGPYQAVARQQAVTGLSSAQRLAAAYDQQAQLLPVMHLAELNRQRQFQQPAASTGDLASLLQQAGISG